MLRGLGFSFGEAILEEQWRLDPSKLVFVDEVGFIVDESPLRLGPTVRRADVLGFIAR